MYLHYNLRDVPIFKEDFSKLLELVLNIFILSTIVWKMVRFIKYMITIRGWINVLKSALKPKGAFNKGAFYK